MMMMMMITDHYVFRRSSQLTKNVRSFPEPCADAADADDALSETGIGVARRGAGGVSGTPPGLE